MLNNTSKSNVVHSVFKSTGVRHEFPQVDLIKQQVTGIVIYKEKTYMTVIVDVKTDRVKIQGSVDELGDLSMDRESSIDMFKHQAKFFIENNIANPQLYVEEIIKNQS